MSIDDLRATEHAIESAAETAVEHWFRRQTCEPETPMHLYYQPGEIGFWIGTSGLNDEWIKDIPITADLTREGAKHRIMDRARKLPILPGALEDEKEDEPAQPLGPRPGRR